MHRSNWSEFLLLIITIHTMKLGFMYHLSSEPFCTLNWRAQFVHPRGEKKGKKRSEIMESQNALFSKHSTSQKQYRKRYSLLEEETVGIWESSLYFPAIALFCVPISQKISG